MARLKDVAALAGVSAATASLALNGGPVNAKTRVTVQQAAQKLNYVPNKVGRMLMSGRSNAIEMIIMTIDEHPNLVRKTALYYYLMEGVLAVSDLHRMSVRFAVKSHDDRGTLQYFRELAGSRIVDGAIIIPQFTRDSQFIRVLDEEGFPYVLLRPAAFGSDVNFVDMGNMEGGKLVADQLLSVGAKRVAIINGPASHVDAIEREAGFTTALFEGGGSLVAKVNGDFTIESGFVNMEHIASRGLPDAVFCANDYMAAGAMKYLARVGAHVPGDVALIGYDNNDVALAVDPELTTVDNRFFDLGSSLASNLLQAIDKPGESISSAISPRLVVRGSHLLGQQKAS